MTIKEYMSSNSMWSIALSLACVLLARLSWTVLNWVWLNPKRLEKILRKQGFKGNSYRLLYGDSKDKARMTMEARLSKPRSGTEFSNDHISHTYPFYYHTVKNYGNKCFMWNGPTPVINLGEAEQMKDVLMKINVFQKPKVNPLLKVVATGLVTLEGDVWAKHRKLLNPAFHMEKLKLMLPAFSRSANDMIQKWEKEISEMGTYEVDVLSDLKKLTADVISRAAFGSSYEEGEKIFELLTEQLRVANPVLNSFYLPGWRFIPTKANRRIMQLDREIKSLLKDIINKRQNAIEAGESPKDDLLGILLETNLKGNNEDDIIGNNKKKKITLGLEDVIGECKIFYIAGQETTSTLLVWTLILLGKHQDWQKRARDEVLNMFNHDSPDFHNLNQLKIVNMILQEVLRLYPPVSEAQRSVCEDTEVGHIVVPAGALVNLPILEVHQDEKLWGADAKEFKPDRFSEGISKATGGNMSFFGFGWGPRICIGSNFAMVEAKLVLILILQRFSFELSPSYVHAPVPLGTLQPQFGAPIILTKL